MGESPGKPLADTRATERVKHAIFDWNGEVLPTPEQIVSSVTVSPENSSFRRKSLLGLF